MTRMPRTESDKGRRTRAAIADAAIRSFREQGYEATTIRGLADELGMSVGATNYHFRSKNELVEVLYERVQDDHRDAALPRLDGVADLTERLRIVLGAGLDTLAPFHAFAPGFLEAAVSPRSPINPLGADASPARDTTIALFREVVDGASTKLPKDLRELMPEVLLIAWLLVAMFWVYDRSDDQTRTRRLVDRGATLFGLALPLLRMPVLRAPLRQFTELVAEVVR
jgi:AcrR family transcriptional regulator